MRRFALLVLAFWAGSWSIAAASEAWESLDRNGIREALEGRKLAYVNGAWQEFRTSGRTRYNAGIDSWGYREARDNRYSSQWPPSDLWACYRMERSGDRLRFIDASGEVSERTYAE